VKPIERIEDVSFDANGWVPAIAQDVETKRVLMLGYMTEATLRETLESRRMVYFSRSRGERWAKGDTSGDVQLVQEAYFDCEGRSLLFLVEQAGKGACHTGEFSCYFRSLDDLEP
jgi:phosphoribosyl-AMP cyclohydrolase